MSNKKIIERKEQMKKKYPDMDDSRFEYTYATSKTLSVWFIKDDGYRISISDPEFIHNKDEWIYLHHKKHTTWPKIWSLSTSSTIHLELGDHFSNWRVKKYYFPKRNLPYNINKFRIYVNESDYFPSNLPEISVNWYKLSDSHPDIRKEFNYEIPYYSSICAMYVATYLSGISKVHVTESAGIPKITTSLMRFHIYFWLRRFIRYPKLLTAYKSNFSAVRKAIPIKAKYYDSGDGKYIFTGFTNIDSHDYTRFIPSKSNCFTLTGLKLLNQSIEAYIYCILGAQARTRQPIVGMRASALETQDVFRELVEDSIINYEIASWVNNMNKSIVDTNVVLNLAVSRSLWLLPSNMIILKSPVQGYNNKLKVAGSKMNFGVNSSVNKVVPSLPKLVPIRHNDFKEVSTTEDKKDKKDIKKNIMTSTTEDKKNIMTSTIENKKTQDITTFLLTMVVGYLVSKYLL